MKLQIIGIGISFLCAFAAVAVADESPAEKTTVPAPAADDAAAQSVVRKFVPTGMQVSASVAVPTPLFADVKNLQDKTFGADAKLRSYVPAADKFAYETVSAKDGFFRAPAEISEDRPAEQDALTLFRVFVTPRVFTRSKIVVASPQKFELLVNGKRAAEKLSVEDSAEKGGSASADFNFEVERYEVLVKVLTEKDSKLPPTVKFEIQPQNQSVPEVVFSDGSEKRPVTIADVNEVDRLSDAALSPDGKFVMLNFAYLRENGNFDRHMEVRDAATGKIVFFDDSARGYSWMPNGSRLYFRRKEPNDLCSYVAFDFLTREETVLAENLPDSNHGYAWLPDESALIVTKTENWVEESADWKRVLNMADRGSGWRNRSFLLRYDLKTGIFEPLTAGSKTTALMGVSPDSSKIVFSTATPDYSQPEYLRCSLYLLDMKTLKCEPLFEDEKYGIAFGDWSPDSKKFVLFSAPDAFGGLGSALPKGERGNSFDMQAFILDLETRSLDPVSRDFDPAMDGAVWAGDGKIYFSTTDRDLNSVYRYDPATKKYEKIAVPAEIVSRFSVQRDPKDFVPVAYAVGSGAVSFPRAYKVDLKKNSARPVFAEGAPAEEKLAMPEVRSWAFKASDGTDIDGYFFLPPDFDPAKKYPMIVYYYSGTTPTSRVLGSHFPFPLYAAQGYVVYVLQPSGTIGYGQKFSARHLNAWGKRTADDIIEGTKKFCEEHPFVDAKKIGCIGASYGGFMTMYLQTRTDIFAAAVAHAGISDITSYWGEGMWGYSYNAVAAAGSFPWKNREIFVEQSPLFSADKISTPILLCHGLSDVNVPVGESIQMFTALKLLGKPVELLTFTAEDHGIMNYARRRQWMKSHLAWFSRWLKDDPDWWNTLYPDKNW